MTERSQSAYKLPGPSDKMQIPVQQVRGGTEVCVSNNPRCPRCSVDQLGTRKVDSQPRNSTSGNSAISTVPHLNLKGGQGIERKEIHIPEMHKDLFSLTLTPSCWEAGCTWPLVMKGKLTTSPHPCLRVFPLMSQVHANWRMPQLRMAAFDLQ